MNEQVIGLKPIENYIPAIKPAEMPKTREKTVEIKIGPRLTREEIWLNELTPEELDFVAVVSQL
jgi:hypothetical protein